MSSVPHRYLPSTEVPISRTRRPSSALTCRPAGLQIRPVATSSAPGTALNRHGLRPPGPSALGGTGDAEPGELFERPGLPVATKAAGPARRSRSPSGWIAPVDSPARMGCGRRRAGGPEPLSRSSGEAAPLSGQRPHGRGGRSARDVLLQAGVLRPHDMHTGIVIDDTAPRRPRSSSSRNEMARSDQPRWIRNLARMCELLVRVPRQCPNRLQTAPGAWLRALLVA